MGILSDLRGWLEGKEEGYAEYAALVARRPDHYYGPIGRDDQGCVYSWASRGDDLLAESNFEAFVKELEGLDAWLDEDEEYEYPDWEPWFDGAARHWLVGTLDQIVVRMWTPDGLPTPHGIRSYQLHCQLEDYPVLDEDDLSEREYAAYEEVVEEAINHLVNKHDDHDHAAAITLRVQEYARDFSEWSADTAWGAVEDVYPYARDDVYEALAHEYIYASTTEHRMQDDTDIINLSGGAE